MIDNKIFKDNKIICCFHSSDYDGICSAEIVRKYFSDYENIKDIGNVDIKFIGLNYGDKIPYAELIDKVIICCDFTPTNFPNIVSKSIFTLFIDHHKSSINDLKDFNPDNLQKVTSIEYSACEGVWKYFYPDIELRLAVKYLSKFDTFSFTPEEKNDVMNFQFGMKSLGESTAISGKSWVDVFISSQEFIDSILLRGSVVREYHKEHYDIQVCSRSARTCSLRLPSSDKSYRVIFVNSPYSFSEVFASAYKSAEHDIMMVGYINRDKMWCYSFYCPPDKDVDVSVIAKEFGGGGHKGASGCTSKELLV